MMENRIENEDHCKNIAEIAGEDFMPERNFTNISRAFKEASEEDLLELGSDLDKIVTETIDEIGGIVDDFFKDLSFGK